MGRRKPTRFELARDAIIEYDEGHVRHSNLLRTYVRHQCKEDNSITNIGRPTAHTARISQKPGKETKSADRRRRGFGEEAPVWYRSVRSID